MTNLNETDRENAFDVAGGGCDQCRDGGADSRVRIAAGVDGAVALAGAGGAWAGRFSDMCGSAAVVAAHWDQLSPGQRFHRCRDA